MIHMNNLNIRGRVLKQVYNIVCQQHVISTHACSSLLWVYLLKESEIGTWTVVSFIIISIIKITPSEKTINLYFILEPMSGIIDTE